MIRGRAEKDSGKVEDVLLCIAVQKLLCFFHG